MEMFQQEELDSAKTLSIMVKIKVKGRRSSSTFGDSSVV